MNAPRIWEPFLSEGDRAWAAQLPRHPIRLKGRAGLLLIDLYRGGFGDEPQPLLEAIKRWPWSCGENGWRALPKIKALLTEARALSIPVIHSTMRSSEDGLKGWIEALRQERPGALVTNAASDEMRRRSVEIIDEVRPIAGEAVIEKAAPSAFWGTPLLAHLRQLDIGTLFVAGMATSGCVRASVVDGAANRLNMIVVEDCVFDRIDASHAINLFDMHVKYGHVVPQLAAIDLMRTWSGCGAGHEARGEN